MTDPLLLLLLLLLLLVLPAPSSSAPAPPWSPPTTVSPSQRALFQRWDGVAAALAEQATAGVLAALDDPVFRANLSSLHSGGAAALPAAQLLEEIEAQWAVSEVVHQFDAAVESPVPECNNCLDVDLQMMSTTSWLYNGWEVALQRSRDYFPDATLSGWLGGEAIYESQLGYPPFGNGSFEPGLRWPTGIAQAAERPIYTAVNSRRVDAGVPGFGSVSLVLSPKLARDATVLAPTDSGMYEGWCNTGGYSLLCAPATTKDACQNKSWFCDWTADPAGSGEGRCAGAATSPDIGSRADCSVWLQPQSTADGPLLGTMRHFRHLLLPNVTLPPPFGSTIYLTDPVGKPCLRRLPTLSLRL
jgi:hypothetical protein